MLISYFVTICLLLILSMSFFTLLERKVLGYMQLRKGPSKVAISGVFQPFSDAIKLFSKESLVPKNSNKMIFISSSILMLSFSLLLWSTYVSVNPLFYVELCVMYFLCISSLSVYTTLLAGWSSNSKYAFLGGLRSIAQTISYEISSSFILLIIVIYFFSFNFFYMYMAFRISFLFFFPFLFIMWMISMLAETNRTPFDFVEGESELVSGFNVEYSSELFVLLFMAEYLNILFVSYMSVILFFPLGFFGFEIFFYTVGLAYFFIHVRGSLPRLRYDCLMSFCWKSILPVTLGSLILFFPLFIIFIN